MATFLSVMGAFAVYLGAAPLFGRAPVIVRPRVNAAVLALAAGAEFFVQALTWATGGGGSPNPFGVYAMPVFLIALVASALMLRGVDVHGVRDEAFGAALRFALDRGGYGYDLRVDGRERIDLVVMTERLAGAEIRVRSRDGFARLWARGGLSLEALTDVVDDMEAYLREGDATTSWGTRAASLFLVVLGLGLAIAAYFF